MPKQCVISKLSLQASLRDVGTNALFGNCIVYGNNDNELDFEQSSNAAFVFKFDHTAIKTTLNTSDVNKYAFCFINTDPAFILPGENNYQLSASSTLINAAVFNGVTTDLLGKPRDADPDPGCYEFIPAK